MWQSVSQGYLLKNVEAFPYIVLLRDLRKPEIFSSSDQKGKRKELTRRHTPLKGIKPTTTSSTGIIYHTATKKQVTI